MRLGFVLERTTRQPSESNSNSMKNIFKSNNSSTLLLQHPSMATLTNFLAKQTPYLTPITKTINPQSSAIINHLSISPSQKQTVRTIYSRRSPFLPKAAAAATDVVEKKNREERVQKVHSIEEFNEALRKVKNRLVVVEYAARDSENSSNIYPFMVDLSHNYSDIDFLLVMGDESEETKKIFAREKMRFGFTG